MTKPTFYIGHLVNVLNRLRSLNDVEFIYLGSSDDLMAELQTFKGDRDMLPTTNNRFEIKFMAVDECIKYLYSIRSTNKSRVIWRLLRQGNPSVHGTIRWTMALLQSKIDFSLGDHIDVTNQLELFPDHESADNRLGIKDMIERWFHIEFA
jgi:hypothetical protein